MTHPGELLSAYFDDELSHEERAIVGAHLEGCADCRHELEAVQTAAVAVRSLPELDPPPGLVPARAPWHRRRRWQGLGAIAAGATAVVALVVGVAVVGDSGSDPSSTVLVALEGLDSVPVGDRSVTGEQRAQAIDAALSTMTDVEEMDMASDDMMAKADVMMGDEPMKVEAGLWYDVADEYVALMSPAEGIVGLWVANESGAVMAFFFCEHSWYRVESASGLAPDLAGVVSLRSALGCEG